MIADLKLRRSAGTRTVAGRVVDTAGKPVLGAEVSQSGDGPKRTQRTTDRDGRFRVTGVPNTPAFLFVTKEGYHFVGRRVDPKDRSIEFTLRRLDEPPAAPLRLMAAAVSRDEERTIARTLIVEARKYPGGVLQMAERTRIPEIIAMVDPERAIEMIENQVLPAGPNLLTALAIARFEGDPRWALEIFDAIEQPETASLFAVELFERLGATASPELRRELLERAAREALRIEDSGQAASLLARTADRWFDLGDTEHGAVVVRKAQVLAKKPRPANYLDPRANLAPVLARIDLPAALKLLEGPDLQPQQVEMIRTEIAQRTAANDPGEARRLLGRIEEFRRSPLRRILCYRIAAKDLAAARALAAEDHDPVVEAMLPVIAARSQARSDPAGARVLLREAVERLGKIVDREMVRPSPDVSLASLLPLAVRIDPERAPDYLWLALSRRPPLLDLPESSMMISQVLPQYLDRAQLAVLVSRYDRIAAETVFAPVADRIVRLLGENWGLGNECDDIFRAAGTVNARLARTMLDILPDDSPPPENPPGVIRPTFHRDNKALARIALAETLGLPPRLRLHKLFPPGPVGWLENFDD